MLLYTFPFVTRPNSLPESALSLKVSDASSAAATLAISLSSFLTLLGPSFLTCSVNSVTILENFSPSDAETHSSLSLSASSPLSSKRRFMSLTLFSV